MSLEKEGRTRASTFARLYGSGEEAKAAGYLRGRSDGMARTAHAYGLGGVLSDMFEDGELYTAHNLLAAGRIDEARVAVWEEYDWMVQPDINEPGHYGLGPVQPWSTLAVERLADFLDRHLEAEIAFYTALLSPDQIEAVSSVLHTWVSELTESERTWFALQFLSRRMNVESFAKPGLFGLPCAPEDYLCWVRGLVPADFLHRDLTLLEGPALEQFENSFRASGASRSIPAIAARTYEAGDPALARDLFMFRRTAERRLYPAQPSTNKYEFFLDKEDSCVEFSPVQHRTLWAICMRDLLQHVDFVRHDLRSLCKMPIQSVHHQINEAIWELEELLERSSADKSREGLITDFAESVLCTSEESWSAEWAKSDHHQSVYRLVEALLSYGRKDLASRILLTLERQCTEDKTCAQESLRDALYAWLNTDEALNARDLQVLESVLIRAVNVMADRFDTLDAYWRYCALWIYHDLAITLLGRRDPNDRFRLAAPFPDRRKWMRTGLQESMEAK